MILHGQMKTVTAIESRMTKSKMIMRRIFNASTTLAPINNLPLEVLSRIFMILVSSARCTADYPCDSYPPIVIAAVCSRRRHPAIITRSFWSHVDICELDMTSDSDPELTPRTRLCLERARDAPLWLHISKPRGSWGTGSETLLLSLLTPYMTNVESMRFSGILSETCFHTTLSLYANRCSPRQLKSLLVELWLTTEASATGRLIWPTRTLHGITDLQSIGLAERISPSMNELVSMLLNSPNLRTLRLRNVHLSTDANEIYPKISVPALCFLELSLSQNQALSNLLSALIPGSHELELLLELPTSANDNLPNQITSFLERANVVCLGLKNLPADTGAVQLARYLNCTPRIRILGLNCSNDKFGASLNALTMDVEGDEVVARCPSLRLLCIMEWKMDSLAQLKRTVRCHHLSTVVLGDRVGILGQTYDATLDILRKWPGAKNVVRTRSQFFKYFVDRYWVPCL
ncbi:hypothetical protein FRC12_000552 [Ceratobasidium sp. 428]|nr:hypothetical protein FRC12_000552 [Ceratobasidium sp. 428]